MVLIMSTVSWSSPTVVTNALIERKGRPTATGGDGGFSRLLFIRNEHRYEMYDPQIEFPEPLGAIGTDLCHRTNAPWPTAQIADAAGRKAIDRQPGQPVRKPAARSAGRHLLPQQLRQSGQRAHVAAREAEACCPMSSSPRRRTSRRRSANTRAPPPPRSTPMPMPISQPYLQRLSERLETRGFRNSPLIMLSSGGVVGAETAGRNPVRMIESGPAAGALAALPLCRTARASTG